MSDIQGHGGGQMQTESISEKLSSYVTGLTYGRLPHSVIEKVKLCILDLFGAHFAGYDLESCKPVKEYISSLKAAPQATVWSMGTRAAFIEAAFANSAMSHITVFDDMHAKTASHYGSMVIPAAVAVGEHLKCSGKDLILAIVCGYETAIRIGSTMVTSKFMQSGFRPSGTFGAFGSAISTGKLLGLNFNQMVNALGLAGNFGVGLMAFAEEGTDDLMYHNSLASRNGILSAELAKYGARSPRYIFEIEGGVFKAYSGEIEALERIVDKVNDHYKIEEVYFKSVPACAFVQSAAMAALEIAKKEDFNIDDVKCIEVRIFPFGKHYPGLDYCGPFHGVMQAQMSNPFTIASILIRKGIRFQDFVNFQDPSVQSLSTKIQIIEDAEATSRWPEEQLAKVEVFLKDGSTRKGISNNPHFLKDDEVVDKCRLYVGRALDTSSCNLFVETVQSIETLDDINKLTEILNKKGRD
jgi:2-methylcitrate dehydratase PrpD